MKKNIHTFFKNEGCFFSLSIVLPILVMIIVYAKIGVYPGSEHRTILASDSFSQYANFFASLNNTLRGEQSIFYTWNSSLGLNYWSFISYYLGGIFSPLVIFFNNLQMPDFLYYLTLLKIGCIGGAFWLYAYRTFKIPRWGQLIMSFSYALMSFTVAYSEIVMWQDSLMYLPLIILGINRLMDRKQPILLFISYFLLFVSNFYMAFIVGVFSFLYYWVRLFTEKKQYLSSIPMYLITSLLAGGASMIIILPTIADLSNNGESFSEIAQLKTKYTGLFDVVIKNMVGVYDSTKLVSTPYIYVGLIALVFSLFFFLTKKINWQKKLSYGLLLLFIFTSFYLEPLNLMWQGMHTPNMFNFRFSFVFSFLLLTLAGYGWEKFEKEEFDLLATIVVGLITAYIITKLVTDRGDYDYINPWSLLFTLGLLLIYLFLFFFMKKQSKVKKWLSILFVLFACSEAMFNSYVLISGILYEWHYPSRKYYAEPYEDIKTLVDKTKEEAEGFYRMENLNPVSANDAFNYGYSGVNMFSSIRNRHSSYFLNALGYRSTGTNLNIRYANNTLIMDALVGIKYNLAQEDNLKFGYSKIAEQGEFSLYENNYALPLGMLTDAGIYEKGAVETQVSLLNHLAALDEVYFSFDEINLTDSENVTIETNKINKTDIVTYTPNDIEEPVVLEWEVDVPAGKQGYVSIYPVDYKTFAAPVIEFDVEGTAYQSSVVETGQYYSLGYYEEAKTVKVKMTITNLEKNEVYVNDSKFTIVKPEAAFLDVNKFVSAVENIQKKAVDFEVSGRKATAEVDLSENQVIFTTIPYDKGWKAYIDGEEAEIPIFKQALLTLPVEAGKHTIEFVFLPQGFVAGTVLFILCTGSFIFYIWLLRKNSNDPFYTMTK
ncbi:YfhO family protein [Enterococcus sp. BWT-B8]|uniref:YfhO family protein n=1 Tax=Enterococcus sp. BWT-B8 TaxID=2885157 RepID=UPI001E4601E4|nr:YfhO family protein [Enterococcus sp. BWT-B8]MCB5951340.1 YfhO family protein [Enterococcus sp. BWT-B8]